MNKRNVRKILVLLFATLIVAGAYTCGGGDDKDPGPGPRPNIHDGRVRLPLRSPLKAEELTVVSLFDSSSVEATGNFNIELPPDSDVNLIFVSDGDTAVLLGYKAGDTSGNFDVSPKSTALALTMMCPYLIGSSSEQRQQISILMMEHPTFNSLVEEIKQMLIDDPQHTLDGQANSDVYLQAAQICRDVLQSYSSGNAPAYQNPNQLPSVPSIEDASGNQISLKNDKFVFYVAGIYSDTKFDTQALDPIPAVIQLQFKWPPVTVMEPEITPYSLEDGDYNIGMTMGFEALNLEAFSTFYTPSGIASKYNAALLGYKLLGLVVTLPSAPDFADVKFDKFDAFITMYNGALDRDVFVFLDGVGDFLLANSDAFCYLLWQTAATDSSRQFASWLHMLVGNVSWGTKLVDAANDKIPFFYDFINGCLNAKHFCYDITQSGGVITKNSSVTCKMNFWLNTPTGISATADSCNKVTVKWVDNSENDQGFKIERKTGVAGTYNWIYTVGANVTTYQNTGLSPSTQYYYRVRASNGNGDSDYSNESVATTLSCPQATVTPTTLTFSATQGGANPSAKTLTISNATGISWTLNKGATTWLTLTPASGSGNGSSSVSVNIAGMTAGTYTATITPGATGGTITPASIPVTLTIIPIPPDPPTGLTGSAPSSSQVNLSWSQTSTNETGFKIERKTGAAGTYSQIGTVGANVATYQDTTVSASTTYYYRVRAYNAAGDSAYCPEVSVIVPPPTPTLPAPPSGLTGNAPSSSQVNLSWVDASNNETGFKIERKTGAAAYSQIGTVGANVATYQDTTVSASTTYYYRVRAYNAAGNSAYCSEYSITTPPDTSPPNGGSPSLTATPINSSQVNLVWTDNSTNESGFKIERKTGVAGTYSQIDSVVSNMTSYSDTSVGPSTTYYYRVYAWNAYGNSSYSNEAPATTPPNQPDLTCSFPSGGPGSVGRGIFYNISVRVNRSEANLPAGGYVLTRVYLSTTADLSGTYYQCTDDASATSRFDSNTLNSSGSLTQNVACVIPGGMPTGWYWFVVYADPTNYFAESNESNNFNNMGLVQVL